MSFPDHKTKIVATIGPASKEPAVIAGLLEAGMNVARLNFSHGDFESHAESIQALRRAADQTGRDVSIMADLPGPKIRLGGLRDEPVELESGAEFTLTTDGIAGDARRASVNFERLPQALSAQDCIFINDGNIQLEVLAVSGSEIRCRVVVGGELRSRKGLNLPGIDLGLSAFTQHDRECLDFALAQGVDAVSQSFVERGADIEAVRDAAHANGRAPFLIAKIERAGALEHIDEILAAADGIMVARGDLGVEIPIERIAVVQKDLMRRANAAGKPVITATQMLESMIEHRRPTRAEATDVANAVLDGTDAVMLSGESAMGRYPVEAVEMLGRIAAATEEQLATSTGRSFQQFQESERSLPPEDLIALGVVSAARCGAPALILVPTLSGATARSIARFRLPAWIGAVSSRRQSCRDLAFSWGVSPFHVEHAVEDWKRHARELADKEGLKGRLAILLQGPSPENPYQNHRLELLELKAPEDPNG